MHEERTLSAEPDSPQRCDDAGLPPQHPQPRQPTLSTNRFALLSSSTVRKGNLLKSPVARDICKLTERMVVNMNGATSQVSRPLQGDEDDGDDVPEGKGSRQSVAQKQVVRDDQSQRVAHDDLIDVSSEDEEDDHEVHFGACKASASEAHTGTASAGFNMSDDRLRRIEQQFANGKKGAARHAAKNCSQKNSHLLKSKSHQELQHKFTHLLVIDFEATCDSAEPNYPHEIIEFPCIAVDLCTLSIVSEFGTFVKPVRNPILTEFCTALTSIQQSDVAEAPLITDAIVMFNDWLAALKATYDKESTERWAANVAGDAIADSGPPKKSGPPPFNPVFATDGPWDMRKFMHECHVIRDGVTFPELFYKWIDVRRCFSDFFHKQLFKLTKMLRALGMTFVGERHRGIDDSRNIARVAIALAKRGYKFRQPASIPYFAEGSKLLEHERHANALLREIEEEEAAKKAKNRKGGKTGGKKK